MKLTAALHAAHAPAGRRFGTRAVAVTALVLGALIVWIVGFAPVSAVHNAAHDGRHVAGFPCH